MWRVETITGQDGHETREALFELAKNDLAAVSIPGIYSQQEVAVIVDNIVEQGVMWYPNFESRQGRIGICATEYFSKPEGKEQYFSLVAEHAAIRNRIFPGTLEPTEKMIEIFSRALDTSVAEEPSLGNADYFTGLIRAMAQESTTHFDFTLHLHLYDSSNNKVGLISYTSNHTTFSPRTTKYEPDMLDHANDVNGGRMSQIYFDIHQGLVQNLQLMKNDIVFQGNHIKLNQRLHPKLGDVFSESEYADAYDSDTITMQDLFVSFVKKSMGLKIPGRHDEHLQFLRSQKLTHKLFSSAYVLIAEDFEHPGKSNEIIIEL